MSPLGSSVGWWCVYRNILFFLADNPMSPVANRSAVEGSGMGENKSCEGTLSKPDESKKESSVESKNPVCESIEKKL